MRSKPYVVLIVAPVVAYLAALVLVAALVVRPSTLGWVGLGVVSAGTLLAAGLVVFLFPRMRAYGARLHPRVGDTVRLLVVTDAHCDSRPISEAVRRRVAGRTAEVLVVAPVLVSPLHFLAGDEHREAEDARVRLTDALQALGHLGIDARGVVGADDPLQAIADALAGFPADEVVLVASPGHRFWLEQGIERRARDLYGVHVSTVIAETETKVGERR
jgi:hypothetical protein